MPRLPEQEVYRLYCPLEEEEAYRAWQPEAQAQG